MLQPHHLPPRRHTEGLQRTGRAKDPADGNWNGGDEKTSKQDPEDEGEGEEDGAGLSISQHRRLLQVPRTPQLLI